MRRHQILNRGKVTLRINRGQHMPLHASNMRYLISTQQIRHNKRLSRGVITPHGNRLTRIGTKRHKKMGRLNTRLANRPRTLNPTNHKRLRRHYLTPHNGLLRKGTLVVRIQHRRGTRHAVLWFLTGRQR